MSDGFVLNSWGPPQADATPAATMPNNNQGPAPLAASPTVIPPAPIGANNKVFREEASKKAADDDQLLRTKAQGAIEFLDLSPSVKKTYQDSPDVFGPWRGSEGYQAYVRSPTSMLPGVGDDVTKNMEKFNQVKSATKQLSTLGLKAAFGGRITNAEMEQHNAMMGGLTAASADSAVQSVERMESQHFNTLQHAVDRGLIDPSRVPRDTVERGVASGALDARRFLPTISSPSDASRLPRGSLFVNPDGKVLKVP